MMVVQHSMFVNSTSTLCSLLNNIIFNCTVHPVGLDPGPCCGSKSGGVL